MAVDERDLRELTNRHFSLLTRNCIFDMVPRWFINMVVDKARETVKKHIEKADIAGLRKKMLKEFDSIGIYQADLEKYLGHAFDTTTPEEITELQSILNKQTKQPISGATINREIALIRHALKKAIRWGYIDHNPAIGLEHLPEKRRDRYVTPKEWEALHQAASIHAESHHLIDLIDALYYAGQRLSRILKLKWSQVNLQDRTMTFENTSRNKRVSETLYISDPMLSILIRLKGKRALSNVVGPYVFAKPDGTPYHNIKTTWKRCCRDAKIKDARIHDIRHRSITDMISKGWSVSQVGKVVGHSNSSTTDRYTHLQVEATRGPLESLSQMG